MNNKVKTPKLTRSAALSLINASEGKILTVVSTTKRGERTFVFSTIATPSAKIEKMGKIGYLTILDRVADEPRNINVQKMSKLVVDNTLYKIK